MNPMLTAATRWLRDDEGQDLIEYALLAALIALAAVVAMQATGTSINGVFNSISGQLTSAVSGS
jgi:pilus assembly protein Flp/PilA